MMFVVGPEEANTHYTGLVHRSRTSYVIAYTCWSAWETVVRLVDYCPSIC